MKYTFTLFLSLFWLTALVAQPLLEVTDVRLYEHHSDIEGLPFLSGDRSGYDLVERDYARVHDDNQDPIPAAERAKLDIHEYFPFNQSTFEYDFAGFTSGDNVNGMSGGNGLTLFSKAPSSFDYDAASTMADLASAYDASNASQNAFNLAEDDVFIANVRGQNTYVAIKITAVKLDFNTAVEEFYFDFSYKYPSALVGIDDRGNDPVAIQLYPNPVQDKLTFSLDNDAVQMREVKLYDLLGNVIEVFDMTNRKALSLDFLNRGVYLLSIQLNNNTSATRRITKY